MIYKSVTEFEAVLAVLEDSVDRLEEAVYEDCPDDNDLESNWEESDSSWYDELVQARKELADLQESYGQYLNRYIQFEDTILYPIHALDGNRHNNGLYPCIINIDHKFPNPTNEREQSLNNSIYKVTITKIDDDMETNFRTRIRPYLSDVIPLIEKSNPGKFIQKWDYENDCLIP
jgi:hypothetical protein